MLFFGYFTACNISGISLLQCEIADSALSLHWQKWKIYSGISLSLSFLIFHVCVIFFYPLPIHSTLQYSEMQSIEQWFSTLVSRHICVSRVSSCVSPNNDKPQLWAFSTCNLTLVSWCVTNFQNVCHHL